MINLTFNCWLSQIEWKTNGILGNVVSSHGLGSSLKIRFYDYYNGLLHLVGNVTVSS